MQKYITTPIYLRPRLWQYIIDEQIVILLTIGCYAYAGIDGLPCQSLSLGIAVLLTIYLSYRLAWYKTLAYIITEEQLLIEYGVFTRSRAYMELFRVIDFYEHKSFLQQLFGLKTVSIYSGDRTTPRVDIIGMKESTNLVELIRQRVTLSKKAHGIYEITNR